MEGLIAMKRNLAWAALLLGSALASPSLAQDAGTYVQLNLGGNFDGVVDLDATIPPDTLSVESDLETGLFGSIAAGSASGQGFSFEGEALYFNADIDTDEVDAILGEDLNASVKAYAFMVNGAYSFAAGSFSPYVGAGIGYGISEYEFAGESDDDGGIAWQARAGVTFPMSDRMTWDIGYRYLSLPGFEMRDGNETVDADGTAHVVTVGARFAF